MKKSMIVAALALLLTAVGTEKASAGGKGKGHHIYSAATLIVSPNPVPLNSTSITISGSGFGANQVVVLDVSGWIPAPEVTTDASGSFSYFYSKLYSGGGGGTYYVDAWVYEGRNLVRVARAYYTVQ